MKSKALLLACVWLLFTGCWQSKPGPSPVLGPTSVEAAENLAQVNLETQALSKIPIGTVIAGTAPEGWSHLVLFATPTLTEQDRKDAPKMAGHYAQLFKFTILAQVAKTTAGGPERFVLDKVARGFAIDIKGKETIVDGKNTLKADLGQFGRMILDENEKCLDNDVKQIVRTESMLVFDAQAVMRQGDKHVKQVMRHALVVAPESGRLGCFVWLLDKPEQDGRLTPVEKELQLLPPNMREERLLSVKRDKFNLLGVPSPDAFALMRVPPGAKIDYTKSLLSSATPAKYTAEHARELEKELRDIVRTKVK